MGKKFRFSLSYKPSYDKYNNLLVDEYLWNDLKESDTSSFEFDLETPDCNIETFYKYIIWYYRKREYI